MHCYYIFSAVTSIKSHFVLLMNGFMLNFYQLVVFFVENDMEKLFIMPDQKLPLIMQLLIMPVLKILDSFYH